MGIGALAGGLPTGGIGAVPGAMLGGGIGGALGTGAGALMGMGAEQRAEPAIEEEEARLRREMERQARSQAALDMLGGF
jgi:outer membrane lipoprotein SlyB